MSQLGIIHLAQQKGDGQREVVKCTGGVRETSLRAAPNRLEPRRGVYPPWGIFKGIRLERAGECQGYKTGREHENDPTS